MPRKYREERLMDANLQMLLEIKNSEDHIINEMKSNKIDRIVRNEVLKTMKEEEERRKKKDNLILYNIPEVNASSSKERVKEEDMKKVQTIFKDGMNKNHVNILKVMRLGKRREEADYKRPVLVKLENEEEKWSVLKEARNLRNAENWMKKVGISLDLSKEDREKEKILVTELKERRSKGEKGWYIRGDRLCQRIQGV